MQHILNIAFDFDDNAIKEKVERDAFNEVVKKLREDVNKSLLGEYWNRDATYNLRQLVSNKVDDIIREHKEDIIKAAAMEVANSIRRTKKCREVIEALLTEGGTSTNDNE